MTPTRPAGREYRPRGVMREELARITVVDVERRRADARRHQPEPAGVSFRFLDRRPSPLPCVPDRPLIFEQDEVSTLTVEDAERLPLARIAE